MQLLLVDDDAMSRELWTMLLEGEGHTVEAAGSGEEALLMLERGRVAGADDPSLVLTDMQMPGIAGTPFAHAIRAICEETLILAMSGSQPSAEELEGFAGFLLKPFTIEALDAAISGAKVEVPRQDAPKVYVTEVQGHDTLTLQASEDADGLDEAIFARLRGAMPAGKLQELYGLCLSDASMRIQRMREAAEAGDDAGFRGAAHAIKGGCGMIGAVELTALAEGLEESGLTPGIQVTMVTLAQLQVTCEKFERMLGRRWVCE
jgi:CheY-like chemotaxis protein